MKFQVLDQQSPTLNSKASMIKVNAKYLMVLQMFSWGHTMSVVVVM
jgi:hypothetical protein